MQKDARPVQLRDSLFRERFGTKEELFEVRVNEAMYRFDIGFLGIDDRETKMRLIIQERVAENIRKQTFECSAVWAVGLNVHIGPDITHHPGIDLLFAALPDRWPVRGLIAHEGLIGVKPESVEGKVDQPVPAEPQWVQFDRHDATFGDAKLAMDRESCRVEGLVQLFEPADKQVVVIVEDRLAGVIQCVQVVGIFWNGMVIDVHDHRLAFGIEEHVDGVFLALDKVFHDHVGVRQHGGCEHRGIALHIRFDFTADLFKITAGVHDLDGGREVASVRFDNVFSTRR